MKDLLNKLAPYNKFIVAFLGVVLTFLVEQFPGNEGLQVVVAIAVALGVYRVPNGKK